MSIATEGAPISSQRISPFFETIYQNYNLVWQEVIKVPSLQGELILFENFLNALVNSGIPVQDPYCLFLLDTCSLRQEQACSHQKSTQSRVVDYRLFLNTSIKEKIQNFERPFCDENFIIDHFWRAKFPLGPQSVSKMPEVSRVNLSQTNGKAHKIQIEVFNQAFYQFFNKDTKLIQIEQIEEILNDCFQYLLKKNKKSMSKRSFKSVIQRNYKFLFPMIIHNYHKIAQDHTLRAEAKIQEGLTTKSSNEQFTAHRESLFSDSLNQISSGNRQDTASLAIECHKQSTSTPLYPDSLNGRSASKGCPITAGPSICSNVGNDTVIQQQIREVYQTSSFTANRQREQSVSEGEPHQRLNMSTQEMDGVFKLFNALSKIQERVSKHKGFKLIKRNGKRKVKQQLNSTKQASLDDKENQRPAWMDTYGSLNEHIQGTSKSRPGNRNPLTQRQTTFSFNNSSSNQEEFNMHQQQMYLQNYQSHQKLHIYDPYQDGTVTKLTKQNHSHMASNQQSIGSLAISNTSTKDQNFADLSSVQEDQYPIQLRYQPQMNAPFSTKSSKADAQKPPIDHHYMLIQQHQHDYLKPETNRYSNQNTTIGTVLDYNVSHDHELSGGNRGLIYGTSIQQQDDVRSFKTNATISSRRQGSCTNIVPSHPPPMCSIVQQNNRRPDVKYSSTPKIMTLISTSEQLISEFQPGAKQSTTFNRPVNSCGIGNMTTSTIDYSSVSQARSSGRLVRPQSLQDPPTFFSQQEVPNKRRRSGQSKDLVARDDTFYREKYRKQKRRCKELSISKVNNASKLDQLQSQVNILTTKITKQERAKLKERRRQIRKCLQAIQSVRAKLRLSQIIGVWRNYTSRKNILIQERLRAKDKSRLQMLYKAWVIFTFTRKARKDRRKLFRVKIIAIKKLLIQKVKKEKLRAIENWREGIRTIEKKRILSEVSNDMRQASKQMRAMRVILGLTKMEKVCRSRQKQMLYQGLLSLIKLRTKVQFRLNVQAAHARNPLAGRNSYNQLQSRTAQVERLDFSMKMNRQRLQHNLIDGIDKLYQIIKRQDGQTRRQFFNKWRYLDYEAIVGQLDISNDMLFQQQQLSNYGVQPPFQTAVFSHTINAPRSQSLNQPSFYKTNEGFYFSAENEPRRMQSTTIVFSPSPKMERHNNSDNASLKNNSQVIEIPKLAPPQPHPFMKTISFASSSGEKRPRSGSSSKMVQNSYNYPKQRQPYHQTVKATGRGTHEQGIIQREQLLNQSDKVQLNEALAYLKAKVGKGR